jgi:hypothetical protein
MQAIPSGKVKILAHRASDSIRESALESYAQKALPNGTAAEREEYKRYWRDQIWRAGDSLRAEHAELSNRPWPILPAANAKSAEHTSTAPRKAKVGRAKNDKCEHLKNFVRQQKKMPNMTHCLICYELDKRSHIIPPGAQWESETWVAAYRHETDGPKVRKWLSSVK